MSAGPKRSTNDSDASEIVNTAGRQTLSEDAADREEFEKRRRERTLDFEDVVNSMKRRGKL